MISSACRITPTAGSGMPGARRWSGGRIGIVSGSRYSSVGAGMDILGTLRRRRLMFVMVGLMVRLGVGLCVLDRGGLQRIESFCALLRGDEG